MNAAAFGALRFAAMPVQALRLVLPLLALLGLLLPSYRDAALGVWQQQEQTYAPLLAGLAFCLIAWRLRELRPGPHADAGAFGFSLAVLGAAVYAVGRSQQIELLELAACIALIGAAAAVLGGRAVLRVLGFPILFLLFALPWPGWLIDSLTGPLKEWISIGAEHLLYAAGYPVARSGVVLALGPYRLLVADACSGLHSLIFLSALGLLYVHLTGRRARAHRFALVAALLPIALTANFVRVLILLLLTYHCGDAVGQGYAHDLAGLILFVSAFAMLTGLDRLLARLCLRPEAAAQAGAVRDAPPAAALPHRGHSLALSLLLLAAAAAAVLLAPERTLAERRPMPDLENAIPQRFGDWRRDERADALLVSPDLQASVARLYGQTLARTYVDGEGRRIMLSIAYGGRQLGNELQAHRPEYCYKAQGFRLADASDILIPTPRGALPARRLVARSDSRTEPVTYWMTVAGATVRPGMQRKLAQLRHGLRGEIPDGVLVRVSSIGADPARAFRLQEAFIFALQRALSEPLQAVIAPTAGGANPG